MGDNLSLFGPDEPNDGRPRLPCFHCATAVRTVLVVVSAGVRREIPCCFSVERGCDAAATAKAYEPR